MKRYGPSLFLSSLVALFMTGCATQGFIPLTDTQIDAAGNLIEKPIGATRDASVAKEHEVHQTLRNRDQQYRKAYEKSGFSMSYEQHEINGVVVMLPIMEFKEAPRFEQPLPTKPSEHPVWRFGEKVMDRGLAAFGIDRLYRFGKSAIDGAGDHRVYQGDLLDSGNDSALSLSGGEGSVMDGYVSPYSVEPEVVVVEPEVVMPEVFGPASLLEK